MLQLLNRLIFMIVHYQKIHLLDHLWNQKNVYYWKKGHEFQSHFL